MNIQHGNFKGDFHHLSFYKLKEFAEEIFIIIIIIIIIIWVTITLLLVAICLNKLVSFKGTQDKPSLHCAFLEDLLIEKDRTKSTNIMTAYASIRSGV